MLIAILLFTLIGIAALGVDVAHLVVARQELRNAADAGALAGARCLYIDGQDYPQEPDCLDSGSVGDVNPNANEVARRAAVANAARKLPVEVDLTAGGNGPDAERGHWSFGRGTLARGFYPNASLAPADLTTATGLQLDADPDFINAVRVTTRRRATRVQALFSGIFGPPLSEGTEMQAQAVAWIGFAGTLLQHEVEQPIALCRDKLLVPGTDQYSCSIARFIPDTGETGGWTDFSTVPANQPNCPGGGTNAADLRAIIRDPVSGVCSAGNPHAIELETKVQTNNGETPTLGDIASCWREASSAVPPWSLNGALRPWTLTLPVLDCSGGNNIAPCAPLVGAVDVEVIWIQEGNPSSAIKCNETLTALVAKAAPCRMGDWSSTDDDGNTRWDAFAQYFQLKMADGVTDATVANGGWVAKAIYFKPSCQRHDPTGHSGGDNFGILAKIPRLVQ